MWPLSLLISTFLFVEEAEEGTGDGDDTGGNENTGDGGKPRDNGNISNSVNAGNTGNSGNAGSTGSGNGGAVAGQQTPRPLIYTVQKGDNLSAIARRHGLKLSRLLAYNPQIVNRNRIYPGQQIIVGMEGEVSVETSATEGTYYTVEGRLPD